MPKKRTYTNLDKQTVRSLLILHGGDVGVVHGLTNIPRRTIYNWRIEWEDDYDNYFDLLAQKISNRADAAERAETLRQSLPDDDSDPEDPRQSFAQLAQLREILMEHLMTLSTNLLTGDEQVNQRTIAITRLLDRVLQLDDILPDRNPEKVIRFEYYYDNAVHDLPPWHGEPRNPDGTPAYPIPQDDDGDLINPIQNVEA